MPVSQENGTCFPPRRVRTTSKLKITIFQYVTPVIDPFGLLLGSNARCLSHRHIIVAGEHLLAPLLQVFVAPQSVGVTALEGLTQRDGTLSAKPHPSRAG
jgi:hypothetical protein